MTLQLRRWERKSNIFTIQFFRGKIIPMLKNQTISEETRIVTAEEEKDIARVRLMEEILSDESKVYDVEIAFYGKEVDPILERVDSSSTDYNDAWRKYKAIVSALSVLEDSELA